MKMPMDCYITTLSQYGCFKMKQANITKNVYFKNVLAYLTVRSTKQRN